MTRLPDRDGWHALYETGCPDLGIPTCEGCPLPACRYDLGPREAAAWLRQAQVLPLLAAALKLSPAAAALGVSRRTVARAKARARGRGAGCPAC